MMCDQDSPRERNTFDERIGNCEWTFETYGESDGSGFAVIRFRGLVFEEEWGVDFEKKMTRICKRYNWLLYPIAVEQDRLTVQVGFGPAGSAATMFQLKRLLGSMKLKASDSKSVDGDYMGDEE